MMEWDWHSGRHFWDTRRCEWKWIRALLRFLILIIVRLVFPGNPAFLKKAIPSLRIIHTRL
jgi:hypothetical protein